MRMPAAGSRLLTGYSKEAVVIKELGRGGQGAVYLVDYGGSKAALKWYLEPQGEGFIQNLEANIKSGAFHPAFLWPQDLVKAKDGGFGYIMGLKPDNYSKFEDILNGAVPLSLSAAVEAGLNIIDAFRALHTRGLSYQDLNDGNFFIDAQTGAVLICDNDNIAPRGENLGILGKYRYMAPEVVTGKSLPTADSDKFSLAVVLFLLLMRDHPLEGARTVVPCMTEEKKAVFFGAEPLFIYDEKDASNRPVKGVHANALRYWGVYPDHVRQSFLRAFSREGMLNPKLRILESEWLKTFLRLRDEIIACPACGCSTFAVYGEEPACINCGEPLGAVPFLLTAARAVPLTPGKRLYSIHTGAQSQDFSAVEGEVIVNKKDAAKWGIRNTGAKTWLLTTPNGTCREVAPGGVARVLKGVKIAFSNGASGEIVVGQKNNV